MLLFYLSAKEQKKGEARKWNKLWRSPVDWLGLLLFLHVSVLSVFQASLPLKQSLLSYLHYCMTIVICFGIYGNLVWEYKKTYCCLFISTNGDCLRSRAWHYLFNSHPSVKQSTHALFWSGRGVELLMKHASVAITSLQLEGGKWGKLCRSPVDWLWLLLFLHDSVLPVLWS